jgi:hypothetical protein
MDYVVFLGEGRPLPPGNIGVNKTTVVIPGNMGRNKIFLPVSVNINNPDVIGNLVRTHTRFDEHMYLEFRYLRVHAKE